MVSRLCTAPSAMAILFAVGCGFDPHLPVGDTEPPPGEPVRVVEEGGAVGRPVALEAHEARGMGVVGHDGVRYALDADDPAALEVLGQEAYAEKAASAGEDSVWSADEEEIPAEDAGVADPEADGDSGSADDEDDGEGHA